MRLVREDLREYTSGRAAISSIAGKLGATAQDLGMTACHR
jgi:hypothetical protein